MNMLTNVNNLIHHLNWPTTRILATAKWQSNDKVEDNRFLFWGKRQKVEDDRYFIWGKRAIFFKQYGPNIKVTWHSGEQSTVAFLCSRSVKIIDIFLFKELLYFFSSFFIYFDQVFYFQFSFSRLIFLFLSKRKFAPII
jgi:hypothetical protein